MADIIARWRNRSSPSRHSRTCLSAGAWLSVLDRLPSTQPATNVALTFDDGPSPTTFALLDVLAAHGATATFFVLGQRVEANPHAVERIISRGHAVYAHGFSHRRFTQLSADEIADEMARAEQLLSRLRPTPSRYLARLPHGSGADHPRIHRALRRWHPGCQIARWTISTQDYELSRFGQDDEVDLEIDRRLGQLFGGASRIDRSIILLHENPYGIAAQSASTYCLAMAKKLIAALASRGYSMTALVPAAPPSITGRITYVHRNDLQLGCA